jgi:P27 family predicted phage terminase small subunit
MAKMPGPPAKPTNLRVVEGDRSRRPANVQEPQLTASEPPFPYFLEELDAERMARQLKVLTVEQLREQAKAAGLTGVSRLRRDALVRRLAAESEGPRARAWRYLFSTIEPMKVATAADGAALALGVEALVEYVDVTRSIEEHGRFWKTSGRYGEQFKKHPGIDAQGKAWNRVIAVLDRFGANPAYRAKVQIAANAAAQGSPWDDLDGLGMAASE